MPKRVKRKYVLVFAAGVAAALLAVFFAHSMLSYVSSSKFCGTTCHEMEGVYAGWKESSHYVNNNGIVTDCVDCHLPPEKYYFRRVAVEAREGIKNIARHGRGRYDPNANQQEVLATLPDERCVHCHSNLLAKPKSVGSRIAHKSSLNKEDPNAPRCVECHNVMHVRKGQVGK